MATRTNLEADLTTASLREAAARRAGDDTQADYWRTEAQRISDLIVLIEGRHAHQP